MYQICPDYFPCPIALLGKDFSPPPPLPGQEAQVPRAGVMASHVALARLCGGVAPVELGGGVVVLCLGVSKYVIKQF